VRDRKALSLEDAVWRLTGHPHQAFRIAERGLVHEGFLADLVAFDAETVGCMTAERVHDLPAGADRLVVRGMGIEHIWVNGVATRRHGVDIPGAAPGRVIRG
jgi:N-acyl-D-aspartate/D-glutamate deacylase